MSLFLLMFFLIYGGTHLYFFFKVRAAVPLGMPADLCLTVFLLLMVCAPILVRVLEKGDMEAAARLMAYAGYLWMGFLFLFFSSSLAVDIYQGTLHGIGYISRLDIKPLLLSHRTALVVPLTWGVIAAVYGYFEARSIRTEKITVASPKIPQTLGKLTVVQISDVHLGLIVGKERLTAMLDKVKEASPDILVSTGDLIDGQVSDLTGLAKLLQEVRPPYGKYAVTGNHELYAGLTYSLDFMHAAGFKVMRGDDVVIPGVITIAGVDDPVISRLSESAADEEQRLLDRVSGQSFTLLLKHRPAVAKGSMGRFDLQLSGHVHKGQLFPFNLVTYLFYPLRAGINHYAGNTALYVSRGTGTWGPPIRFLAPPEVTVIELVHSSESRS
ncbi:MAG TPA: metallophosphoesterase [Geobacteraceae bacterium]|nr:metallophosphoesterase [Geobacteraceae bacterium]